MKTFIAGLALLAGCASMGRTHSEKQTAASFSVVLQPTAAGWAARCDSGCRWREASFECRTACGAIVDQNGLVTTLTPRPEPTAFSFQVERTSTGARAQSRLGTAWKTLSWDCQSAACGARIDAAGVSGELNRR